MPSACRGIDTRHARSRPLNPQDILNTNLTRATCGISRQANTLLVTDWFAHTPPEVLAKNFGVPAETFARIPLQNLWIFQGPLPGDLASDRTAISKSAGVPPHPFIYRLGSSAPTKRSKGGYVQVADSSNFTVATRIATALVTVRPGGVREMHWHPNADEWSTTSGEKDA
jgi:oxalate decarboxylase